MKRCAMVVSLFVAGVVTATVAGALSSGLHDATNDRSTHGAASREPVSLGAAQAVSVALGTPTRHLVVVMLENKEITQVVGNSAAPYLNGTLLPGGKLFTAHYASTHPSLPNYLVLTSGQYGGCVNDACPTGQITGDNLFSEMNQAVVPVSWKVYAETMPSNCYAANKGGYLVRHNPPVYYSNLQSTGGDGTCATNDVSLTRLGTDLKDGSLPDFAMVVPNQWDDMHTDHNLAPCESTSAIDDQVCQGDAWLQSWIPQLLSDGGRNDTTVLVTFDEGATNQGGAGRVLLLELGPSVCSGCTDDRPSNHYGLSEAITQWFGLAPLYPRNPELTPSPSVTVPST